MHFVFILKKKENKKNNHNYIIWWFINNIEKYKNIKRNWKDIIEQILNEKYRIN